MLSLVFIIDMHAAYTTIWTTVDMQLAELSIKNNLNSLNKNHSQLLLKQNVGRNINVYCTN